MDTSPTIPRIIADANVLFPATLRDTLFRLQEERLVEVRLSGQIWEEVTRNLQETGRVTEARVAHLDSAARAFFAIQGMLVEDYEPLIPALTNHPKDRHVLAAAIQAGATSIVTVNLRDFPASALAPFGIVAEHPDAFLSRLHSAKSEALAPLLRVQASEKTRPPMTVDQLLDALAVHVPRFAAAMRATIRQGDEHERGAE